MTVWFFHNVTNVKMTRWLSNDFENFCGGNFAAAKTKFYLSTTSRAVDKEARFVAADLSTITPRCGKFRIFFDRSQVDGVDMRPISYVIITKKTRVVLFIKRSTEKGRSFRYGARGACFTGIVTAALSPERAIFWQKSSV